MKFEDFKQKFDHNILSTYNPLPVIFERGEGSYLYDIDNKEYLDLFAGIAVSNLGYHHPEIVSVLKEQAEKLWHVSNLFINQAALNLAEKLIELSFAAKVFFSNSGTEANEAAFKLARKWGIENKGEHSYHILAFDKSFHGRTFASLSATGQKKFHQGIGPIVEGFHHVPLNDEQAVKAIIDDRFCAIIVEPIQGESGVRVAEAKFLSFLRKICDEKNMLLIFDEIQTGMGRTGKLFNYEYYDFHPDLMTLAKGMGSGLPIGALLVAEKLAEVFKVGDHGTTFGSNVLCTTVALKTIEIISQSSFLDQVMEKSEYFISGLKKLQTKVDLIESIWGQGLMIGIKLKEKISGLAAKFLNEGIVVNVIGDEVLRLVPPLIISKNELKQGLLKLEKVLSCA